MTFARAILSAALALAITATGAWPILTSGSS